MSQLAYLLHQLDNASGDTRTRWQQTLRNILDGLVQVGSRTPVKSTPAWVTLDVIHGGFATGSHAAGGEILDHEHALAKALGVPATRSALNEAMLSEPGCTQLRTWLTEGTYAIDLPEEAALLTVVALMDLGDAEGASTILRAIGPWMGRLRFYPRPTHDALPSPGLLCRSTVGEVTDALRRRRIPRQIQQMNTTLAVWRPLEADLVALFLETLDGAPPRFEGEGRDRKAVGGMPLSTLPTGWADRAAALLAHVESLLGRHPRCNRARGRRHTLGQLIGFLRQWVRTPRSFGFSEQVELRWTLAGHITKHGLPDSPGARASRATALAHAQRPLYAQVAPLLVARLSTVPQGHGVGDLEQALADISPAESIRWQLPPGPVPAALRSTVARARLGTLEELVHAGLVPSAEVLARLVPQITGEVQASSLVTPALRTLSASTYRAFRRRRSLLLLHLQSQVRLEELPWVAALHRHREPHADNAALARETLESVVSLAWRTWPGTLMPNPLIAELKTLATQAGLRLPFVREIAADIFTGRFSTAFVRATQHAARSLEGTPYHRYYGLDTIAMRAVGATDLAGLARSITGAKDHHRVVYNGMMLEGVQILTSHNLAPLYDTLCLQVEPESLAMGCRDAVQQWLASPRPDRHQQLRCIKNAAYAWRQMVFWLSQMQPDQQTRFLADSLRCAPAQHALFEPLWEGLQAAVEGHPLETTHPGHRFLGWDPQHWMLSELQHRGAAA